MRRTSEASFKRRFVKTAVTVSLAAAGAASLAGLAGCSDHGKSAIPGDAEKLTSGDGRDLIRATAPHGGTAYVLDNDDNKIVWSGEVHTDDRIVVDGDANKIKVDDRTVGEDLHRGHRYTIYFYRPGR